MDPETKQAMEEQQATMADPMATLSALFGGAPPAAAAPAETRPVQQLGAGTDAAPARRRADKFVKR